MRTLAELKANVDGAIAINDAEGLLHLATELHDQGTTAAYAIESIARGVATFAAGNYQLALEHYQHALALFTELGDADSVARATGRIATVYHSTGDYQQALEHNNRALEILTSVGNVSGIASIRGNIGLVLSTMGDYPTALQHYQQALALHTELKDDVGIARDTGNLGSVYRITGDFPQSLAAYRSALLIATASGDRTSIANAVTGIGNVYHATADYPQALEYYHRALALFTELGDRAGASRATGNIGLIFNATGNHTKALEHFRQALEIHTELGYKVGVARVTSNIGSLLEATGEHVQALQYYRRALELHHELGNRTGVAIVTGNIVRALLDAGNVSEARAVFATADALHSDVPSVTTTREVCRAQLQELDGDMAASLQTLRSAREISKEHGLKSAEADICLALRNLAQKQNDLPSYIEFNNEYTRITNEINGKETSIKMAMQAKEREIAEREVEHQKHMAVLHSTLPKHIADRVARGETVNDHYDNAAVLFLDIVGFTTLSSSMSASDVVALLDQVFGICDSTMNTHGLMKIKTIGDSYMAVAFDNIHNAARAALDLVVSISEVHIRIGIHCGPVVAGVLGKERMQYDVWGDTVNIASRMESTGEAGRVHVSHAFAESMDGEQAIRCVERGEVEVKGKGRMNTYWMEST
ncbi:hypothetical protein BH10BAC6_BH10BAC6_05820 [soil metagenome]